MEELIPTLERLADLMIISGFLWAGGRITRGLGSMRKLAKATWQRALTETMVGIMAFIGIGAVIVLFTGV